MFKYGAFKFFVNYFEIVFTDFDKLKTNISQTQFPQEKTLFHLN